MYVYPKLSEYDCGVFRLGALGLGNMLFPWARAIVTARQRNWEMIWPTWWQVGIGPIRRGQRDLRFYHNLFSRPSDYIGGLHRLWILSSLRRHGINEREITCGHEWRDGFTNESIVIFAGMEGLFRSIIDDSATVRRELYRIVRPRHKMLPTERLQRSIGVHVRLGDFQPFDEKAIAEGKTSRRLPIEWYVDIVKQILSQALIPMRIVVFSDGGDEELSQLLSLPNTERANFGSAISDMLALSQTSVLVASGSTYSMWASYLGRMPAVWFKGTRKGPIYPEKPEAEVEVGYMERLPTGFFDAVNSWVTQNPHHQ